MRMLLLALVAAAILVGGAAAAVAISDNSLSLAASTTSATTAAPATTGTAREPGEDVSGPCDEAEHAKDARCAGRLRSGPRSRHGARTTTAIATVTAIATARGCLLPGVDDDDQVGPEPQRLRRRAGPRTRATTMAAAAAAATTTAEAATRPWPRRGRLTLHTRAPSRGGIFPPVRRRTVEPPYDEAMNVQPRMVLIVEDEEAITAPLTEALGREGFRTQTAGTLAEGRDAARSARPDIVLLDVMLPDGTGFDLLRDLRFRRPTSRSSCSPPAATRPIASSGSSSELDYVVKPFSARELTARIRAVLRRTSAVARPGPSPDRVAIGEVARPRRTDRDTRRGAASSSRARSSTSSPCSWRKRGRSSAASG